MDHVRYRCPPGCENPHCNYCEGGLFACTVCGGAEITLPKECPGEKMTESQEHLVRHGLLDFRGGQWHAPRKLESGRVELQPEPGEQTSLPA